MEIDWSNIFSQCKQIIIWLQVWYKMSPVSAGFQCVFSVCLLTLVVKYNAYKFYILMNKHLEHLREQK